MENGKNLNDFDESDKTEDALELDESDRTEDALEFDESDHSQNEGIGNDYSGAGDQIIPSLYSSLYT